MTEEQQAIVDAILKKLKEFENKADKKVNMLNDKKVGS